MVVVVIGSLVRSFFGWWFGSLVHSFFGWWFGSLVRSFFGWLEVGCGWWWLFRTLYDVCITTPHLRRALAN